MNMYAYVGNNPVGFVDPMGLCKGDKWDYMSWGEKLGNGYYYGTGHAEDALDYWVGKMVENPDNPVYAGMGTLAGLWQPDNFKKNGLNIALLGGSRLIGKGLSWAGNALKGLRGGATAGTRGYRYMSAGEVEAIKKSGMLRGGNPGKTYFTKDLYKSATKAQSRLSLGSKPTHRVKFEIINSPSMKINGAKVSPLFGQPGKGAEFMTTDVVQVKLINVQPF